LKKEKDKQNLEARTLQRCYRSRV